MRKVAVAAIIVAGLWAQPPGLEVASIKLNPSGSGGTSLPSLKNGTLAAQNVSLLMLLTVAYDLGADRISGPGWLDAARFDMAGKAPQGVPDSELRPMLQALLRDRFAVATHREKKEMAVYELTVAKEGLKIFPFDPAHPPVPPRTRPPSMIIGSGTMAILSKMIAGPAGRPVVDKTGLEGRYTYVLTFAPLSAQAAGSAADPAPPDIFAALREQLGLKLESKRAPLEILVVDHAQRTPSAN